MKSTSKNVYLIIEYGGEWEDYFERIVGARFDKNEANDICNALKDSKLVLLNKLRKLEKNHDYWDCSLDDCEICEQLHDLKRFNFLDIDYRVDEIIVDGEVKTYEISSK